MGHTWQQDADGVHDTCIYCGAVRDTLFPQPTTAPPEGYISYVDFDYSSVRISVGGCVGNSQILQDPVENCYRFTWHFQIVDVAYGRPEGIIYLYYKNAHGKWERIAEMEVSDKEEHTVVVELDRPVTMAEFFEAPSSDGYNYSFSSASWLTDFYTEP